MSRLLESFAEVITLFLRIAYLIVATHYAAHNIQGKSINIMAIILTYRGKTNTVILYTWLGQTTFLLAIAITLTLTTTTTITITVTNTISIAVTITTYFFIFTI